MQLRITKPWVIRNDSIGSVTNPQFISYRGDIRNHTHEFLRYSSISRIDEIDSEVRFSSKAEAERFIENVAKHLDAYYEFTPVELKISVGY